jgi:hypothetical protein
MSLSASADADAIVAPPISDHSDVRARRIELERHPEINVIAGKRELWRHNADDFARTRVQLDGRADDVGIGTESGHPEVVAQDRD